MGAIAGLEAGLPTSLSEVDPPWLTRVLRTSGAIDASTSVATVAIEPFQVGVGLLGQLARASMTYDGGPGPDTVVIKYPIDVPHQRGMADALNAYEREARFYAELIGDSPLRGPKIHAAMISEDKAHTIIVMEDLSALRQADRVVGVTWDEAVTAMTSLAAFHAHWHESDRFEEIGQCWYSLSHPVYGVILPQFIDAGWEKAQRFGAEWFDDDLIGWGNDWSATLPAMQAHLSTPPTLIHADWRADNMFFDDSGDIVTIDFQLAGIGNGAYDVAYFVSQSMERDVRGGRERELVDLYVVELGRNGVERDADQVWFDFRVASAFDLIYGVSSYAEFENLPGEGQSVLDALLRRCTSMIIDVDAIEAVRSL